MLRITLLSALFVLLFGDTVLARTIRVPDDFATIQAAVDAAQPGDRVLIVSGSYTESVVIATERVTLIGEGDHEIVGSPGGDGFAVAVLADGVALKNLAITGTPDVAVLVDDCEDVTVRRCVISGGTQSGILVLASTGTRILVNRLSGVTGAAISLGDITRPLQESTDSRVFANRIVDAGRLGIDSAGGTNRIARNRVEGGGNIDNPVGSTAIQVQGTGSTVLRNRISRFAGAPLEVTGDGHVVSHNVFVECAVFADVSGTAHTLRRNRFDFVPGVGSFGLRIDSDSTDVIGNIVRFAPGNGITVDGSLNFLKKNKVRDSGEDGIDIRGNFVTVQASMVFDSGKDGIDIDAGSDNMLLKNVVKRSGTDGIEADVDATNCLFKGNKVTDAAENGFHVRSGSHTFQKNSATGSGSFDLRSAVAPEENTYIGNTFKTHNLAED